MTRFRQQKLTIDQKPKYVFDYWVTGRSAFPFDMLRYDSCWPAGPEDAMKLVDEDRAERSIHLRSYRAPTIDRWASFVWSVSETNPTPETRLLS